MKDRDWIYVTIKKGATSRSVEFSEEDRLRDAAENRFHYEEVIPGKLLIRTAAGDTERIWIFIHKSLVKEVF